MKTRIITGIIGAVLLITLGIIADAYIIALAAFLAALIGLYEFYQITGVCESRPLTAAGIIGAAGITVSNLFFPAQLSAFICIWLLLIFIIMLTCHEKTDITGAALTIFSVFYIPFLFSYIPLVRMLENGRLIIWFVIVGAFITDTFAYFTGVFLGRHKLCPKISPKKTIEGAIGGTLGCGVIFTLMGYFFNRFGGTGFAMPLLFLFGLLSAIAAQLGDLSASVIKRKYGVKDYGNLFPGHGGIMDRCDSLIFVAPLVYFVFLFM